MTNLKVGDKVMLKETSGWVTADSHRPDSVNPLNTVGEVSDSSRHHELDVEVRWSNGMVNQYNHRDLILQEDPEASKPPTKKGPKLKYKRYTDMAGDSFKIDSEYSAYHVSFEPKDDKENVILDVKQVIALRKQLKHWLVANGHNKGE